MKKDGTVPKSGTKMNIDEEELFQTCLLEVMLLRT